MSTGLADGLTKNMSKSSIYESHKLKAFGTEITAEDAWAFLEDKTSSLQCSACKHTPQTLMLTGPADLSAMVITTQDAAVDEDDGEYHFVPEANTRSLPVFGLWCPNCGHIQLHTIGTLASWIKKKADRNSEDGRNEQSN
ncbi:hypothetical protein [Stenotrophomonas rhizophila]|uniref:hypothetical protein n=1 Tax=Stenotrophomonas rhizophila TaxID=216778 RepID=UPI0028A80C82|nr:hypothetical protein [Stenotrophomonas rhizophila]